MHAGSDHWSIRCATREAEKGNARKAVANAVSPASPGVGAQNMAARDSKGREEASPTEASEKRATKAGQSVTASWTQQSASRMWVDAEVEADGQSWPMHAVPSDLHRRFHADPCERSTLVLHVSATSIFCRSRRAHIPMTRGEAAVQPSSTLMWLLSSGERSQCTTMPAVQGILHAKPRWRGRTKVES